eukprot:3277732-Pleurochrysis_carterae.AAC.1
MRKLNWKDDVTGQRQVFVGQRSQRWNEKQATRALQIDTKKVGSKTTNGSRKAMALCAPWIRIRADVGEYHMTTFKCHQRAQKTHDKSIGEGLPPPIVKSRAAHLDVGGAIDDHAEPRRKPLAAAKRAKLAEVNQSRQLHPRKARVLERCSP